MSLTLFSRAGLLATLLIYLPIIFVLSPVLDLLSAPATLTDLLVSTQFASALVATLTSTSLSLLLSLILALTIIGSLMLTPRWLSLGSRLPYLLAFPHLVFAVGLYVLLSPRGWLERLLLPLGLDSLVSNSVWVQDPYALSLGIALGIKEAWFLCWVLWARVQKMEIGEQFLILQTLGYRRPQILIEMIFPQLLPALKWPLVAICAYSLSSVEMSWVLGPTHPPTLAVLGWQMLLDADPNQRAMGLVVALLLVGLLLCFSAGLLWLPKLFGGWIYQGKRWSWRRLPGGQLLSVLVWLHLILIILLGLWSVAFTWFYPSLLPSNWSFNAWMALSSSAFFDSLTLGLASTSLSLILVICLLELGGRFPLNWLLLPLFIPVLPLVVGQYQLLQSLEIGPSWVAVFWSHLVFVIPYTFLVMQSAYQRLDTDLLLTARTLGKGRWGLLLAVKVPLMIKPIFAALALGFTVSLAQYLPTQFMGAGRIETLTTETVSLFSGGDKRMLGAQASLLLIQALAVYMLAVRMPNWIFRNRKGLV